MRTVASAGLLCALVALTGCTPASPPAQPTPTSPAPTYQCTPESGGTPVPCTEAEYQDMLAKDALYAEAEEVYRAYHAEDVRLYRNGSPASDEILGLVAGDAVQIVRDEHAHSGRLVGGDYPIVWVHRLPGVSKAGSVVALESCTDGSTTELHVDGKDIGPGRIALERSFFAGDPGSLRIVLVENMEVESC